MTKVAINGFGRIGRLVFRGLLDRTDLDIVAINNPSGPETAAYLLKYDTVHGRLNKKVEIDKEDPKQVAKEFLQSKGLVVK